MVIVNETAVTQHLMWLLPSPARARRACPLPGQGEGSEMDTGTESKNSQTLSEARAQAVYIVTIRAAIRENPYRACSYRLLPF